MNHFKDIMDITAASVALGALLKLLPALAALMTIVWTGIRIYDWYKGKKHGD